MREDFFHRKPGPVHKVLLIGGLAWLWGPVSPAYTLTELNPQSLPRLRQAAIGSYCQMQSTEGGGGLLYHIPLSCKGWQ